MALQWNTTLICGVILTIFYLAVLIRKRAQGRSLPPGPPGLPLLGNALSMASQRPWVKYTEWSRLYGLCFVPLTRELVLMINSQAT